MGEGNKILALGWSLTDLNTMADYRVEKFWLANEIFFFSESRIQDTTLTVILKFAFCKQKCCYAGAENGTHRQERGQECGQK